MGSIFLGRFSVAPMLDRTNSHCRHFHRRLSRHTLLYTEMIPVGIFLHNANFFSTLEETHAPVALQLGGCEPQALAHCAQYAEQSGYVEVNLNIGCPAQRVQQGRFGACLMADAALVARCVQAMRDRVQHIPITVKTRLGIDLHDSYAFLADFIATVAEQGGCKTFILHARKAWLAGLSAKQNRTIPPLDYARVYQIKNDFPYLKIVLNGGVGSLEAVQVHLSRVDGVMVGRAAYQNPGLLHRVDSELFGAQQDVLDPASVVESLYPYFERQLQQGISLATLVRPLLGLFSHSPGARQWRHYLSVHACRPGSTLAVVKEALQKVCGGTELHER